MSEMSKHGPILTTSMTISEMSSRAQTQKKTKLFTTKFKVHSYAALPNATIDGSNYETKDSKSEEASQLSKRTAELAKSRYEHNFDNDDKEAFEINEYYDEDFDIEDPQDGKI